MDKRNKRFMGPVAGVAAALGVMMGSGYVALSTDAFIDVGEVTQLAGADTSIYNQQDMRRESQQYLFGIFQNVEEEKIEEDNSSTDGTTDSADDNTYSGDSVYDSSAISGTEIIIPAEYSSQCYTYMGWQTVTSTSSNQMALRVKYFPTFTRGAECDDAFDGNGFGMIEGRYVVAVSAGIGDTGDLLDAYLENGAIIPCIVGDAKSSGDADYTPYGHLKSGSLNVIEFIVDKRSWYNPYKENSFITQTHPNWDSKVVKVVKGENRL